jgi:hypothetical protein
MNLNLNLDFSFLATSFVPPVHDNLLNLEASFLYDQFEA